MTEQTRAQALMDEFKTGLDKDGPIVLAERVAALEAERDTAIKERDEMTELSDEWEKHAQKLEKDIAERAQSDTELAKVIKERDAAIARADKAEADEKTAKAQVRKLTTPARPRKLGAMDDRPSIGELRDAIADADEVSIAFSDGTREVPGIAPVGVSGDVWKDHANGLMLAKPVDIEGAGDAGTSVTIDGYALILDGKQVAYSRRSTPIQIAPGQRVQLVDDIIF